MQWHAIIVIAAGDELWVCVQKGFDDVGWSLSSAQYPTVRPGIEHTLPFSTCLMDGKLGLLCFGVHVWVRWLVLKFKRGSA